MHLARACTAFLLLLASAAFAADNMLPPRVVAPTDKAQFRRFVLDNGMRVLLVSDPNFNKSAASIAIAAGQIDDPKETEGLAHFLEHMLFLGTEKYPDAGEYGNYIRANGGHQNAYTAGDFTNFHFDVRHDALEGGLDRFSQFFIAPRFNPEFVSREVNAVHNEAMRHVQSDVRLRLNVARELYDPASGESRFSTGNKDTLAKADPAAVRAFYESHYSADRMALAVASNASLDQMEKWVRADFTAVPRRNIPPARYEPTFLPPKPALRLAMVQPVKEVRTLSLEFVVPDVRADFASKPDALVDALMSDEGNGGLVERLKREDLADGVNVEVWERTPNYGSLFVTVALTPKGYREYPRVMQEVLAYAEFLRSSPFPSGFYAEHARVAALKETYADRGEGVDLATRLANNALFYPLEVAERATEAWGAPNEAAYRRLLERIRPDNMMAIVQAKGVPTDRKERIYGTAYSYREDTGAAYAALVRASKVGYSLPAPNRFTPANVVVYPERPLPLIDEPGLSLYYAQDVEFQRPSSTIVYRFVPSRDVASLESAALLKLYEVSLREYLRPTIQAAHEAGTEVRVEADLEGVKVSVSGFGASPANAALAVAQSLRTFIIAPERYESLKDLRLRTLRSYPETEAFQLARDRRDAMAREFQYLPGEMVGSTEQATWEDIRAFRQRFFARGRVEVLAHGSIAPDLAVQTARQVAGFIGAAPAPVEQLVRRRHLALEPKEHVVDVGEVAGVNSAFITDFVLPDDKPQTRAAAVLLANFIGEPFYMELRTRQQLGYIVGSAASASQHERFFTFVVQSSGYAPDELRKRAEAFIATLPQKLTQLTDAQWQTLVAGARSQLSEKPKSIAAKGNLFFDEAFTYHGEWDRRESALAALDTLTREQAAAILSAALAQETARRRSVLLYTKTHPMTEKIEPAYSERDKWKATRKYQ
jgi:Secreted/periplasmic Zn-dependent peptidases, insulinase-like